MKTNYLKSRIKKKLYYNIIVILLIVLAFGIVIYFMSALIQVLSEIIFV